MLIRMLRTASGSPDGIQVCLYRVGEVYTVSEALGKAFITDLSWAEPFAPSHEALPVATEKMLGSAPENKRAMPKRGRRRAW